MKNLGIYVYGSPVYQYLKVITSLSNRDRSISEISRSTKGYFDIAGRIRDIKVVYRKADHAPIAKFVLDDETGSIPCLAFVNAYRENKDCIFNGAIVSIHGNAKIDVDPNDEQNTKIEFICRQLRLLIEKKGVTFECTENPGCGYPAPFVQI